MPEITINHALMDTLTGTAGMCLRMPARLLPAWRGAVPHERRAGRSVGPCMPAPACLHAAACRADALPVHPTLLHRADEQKEEWCDADPRKTFKLNKLTHRVRAGAAWLPGGRTHSHLQACPPRPLSPRSIVSV